MNTMVSSILSGSVMRHISGLTGMLTNKTLHDNVVPLISENINCPKPGKLLIRISSFFLGLGVAISLISAYFYYALLAQFLLLQNLLKYSVNKCLEQKPSSIRPGFLLFLSDFQNPVRFV